MTYLDPSGSQLGHKESIADTAAVLGRMYDAIEYRGNSQADVEELAAHASVPVYNGLTDEWHPTQMLADFLTMHEASHKPYDALTYAFVGDCRFNMGRSLLVTGALMGSDVRLAGPADLHPPKDVADLAEDIAGRTGARITITEDPAQAVSGVDFIHTDVWVSMGEAKMSGPNESGFLLPTRSTRTSSGRPGILPSSSCTACPPSTTRTPSWGARSWSTLGWPPAWR